MRHASLSVALLMLACRPDAPTSRPPSQTIGVAAATPRAAIVDLTATMNAACVVLDDHRARCWGRHDAFPALMGRPRETGTTLARATTITAPPLRALRLGDGMAIGRTIDDQLVVWVAKLEALDDVGKVDDIALAKTAACIRQAGEIRCWAQGPASLAASMREERPLTMRTPTGTLPAGPMFLLGYGLGIIGAQSTALYSTSALTSGNDDAARAILEPGRVLDHRADWISFEGSMPREAPVTFGDGTCRLASGRLHCRSETAVDPHRIATENGRVRLAARGAKLWSRYGFLCVADGSRITCDRGREPITATLPNATIVALHQDSGGPIAIGSDGSLIAPRVDTWEPGFDLVGKLARPARAVFSIDDRTCVLGSDDRVACKIGSEAFKPIDLPPIRELRPLGDEQWLARLPDGTQRLLVRDDPLVALREVPWPTNTGEQPLLIVDHALVMAKPDGTARCDESCPETLRRAVDGRRWRRLVETDAGVCGLDPEGLIECMRVSEHAIADGPIDGASLRVSLPEGFRAVDLLGDFDDVCALSDAGDVACWRHGDPMGTDYGSPSQRWLDLTAWVLAE